MRGALIMTVCCSVALAPGASGAAPRGKEAAPARAAVRTLLARGERLFGAGHVRQAIEAYSAAIAAAPRDARAYYQRGVCYERLADARSLRAALADYRAALSRDELFPEAHNNLGALLYGRGDFAGARPHLERAVKLRPSYGEAWFNLGLLETAEGHAAQALAAYERAARLRPTDADVHLNLAGALQRAGKLDEARAHAREAARLRPNDAVIQCAKGELLLAASRWREAEQALRTALALDAHHQRARIALARLMVRRGKPDRAAKVLAEALRVGPATAAVHAEAGQVERRLGHIDAAIGHYRAALRVDPSYHRAYLLIGLAQTAARRCRAAQQTFRRYVATQPGLPADALSRLAKRCPVP